jgi:hypothetical protein
MGLCHRIGPGKIWYSQLIPGIMKVIDDDAPDCKGTELFRIPMDRGECSKTMMNEKVLIYKVTCSEDDLHLK